MKDLLIRIVQALVDDSKKVRVNEIKGGQTVVFELRVAHTNLGRIIGKQGKMANAIRAIFMAASGKGGKNAYSKLLSDAADLILPSLLITKGHFYNILDKLC